MLLGYSYNHIRTVINRKITVINYVNSYGTGTTLHGKHVEHVPVVWTSRPFDSSVAVTVMLS